MVDLICKIDPGQKAAVLSWLASNGVDVNRDEDGVALTKAEDVIGEVCTPILKDINNVSYFMIRFADNVAAKIPDKPNYIIWRSDESDYTEHPVTVTKYDFDGNPDGTTTQNVGVIA
jgi:hypothetical protein